MENRDFIRKMIDAISNDPASDGTKATLNEEQVSISIDGPEADEFLSRLLDLSGQQSQQPAAIQPSPEANLAITAPVTSEGQYVCDMCGLTEDMCECDISVSREGPLLGMTMETAEYDHGRTSVEDEGEVVDPNTYIYKPEQVPQRLSKPGDNPMVSEETMVRYKQLVNDYVSFISESSIPNEDGSASPLTATDREEFDKDPSTGDEPKTDGTMSPMSMVKRQSVMK